jgi:UDP-N-acetylglucosamine 2-epimerase (non-hydrolysing)
MSKRLKVLSVVGTRPNLMKIAPIAAVLEHRPEQFDHVLVHTGQHYDYEMSQIFFQELDIPEPDHYLGVGSGSHSQQTARTMEALEPVLRENEPDVVLVPGDVNSTLAAALVASKLTIPVGHVEAGLRSFDRTMPEEINRLLTDAVSDLLFIHSPEAHDNLVREGAREEAIHPVGNTMIDTLIAMRPRIESVVPASADRFEPGSYLVVTLHRPALVDGPRLAETVSQLAALSEEMPIVFPVHPRTRAALKRQKLEFSVNGVRLIDPIGYIEFLGLVSHARAVLTDSGGIQEETSFLGIPCFTLRDNTERPVTVAHGSNTLLGLRPERIAEIPSALAARSAGSKVPAMWDGHAAERIADVLAAAELPAPRRAGRRER